MHRQLAQALLSSVALAAMPLAAPAQATTVVADQSTSAIQPLYGSINPFYGNINPFYGTINPFYGNIGAFYGNINPFYGNIGAFWGSINPFYGNIGAFSGAVDPMYGTIGAFDSAAYAAIGRYWEGLGVRWQGKEALWTSPLRAGELGANFGGMIADAQLLWAPKILAATGRSFDAAFLNPLLARYGVKIGDPLSLQALSAERRAQFFLDWYDGLMAYSGADRVDHWMRTVNWTPAITQQQGSGASSIIGLLDATALGDPDIANNINFSGGFSSTVNGHGVGVASLLVAAHDGRGVMGIAPNASVIAYNPFDSTNTASWDAVRTGIAALASRNASVINMSLGAPGHALHPDWRNVFFNESVWEATRSRVFVMAAGNDGAAQTRNLSWNWSRDPNLIVVGSVDVFGNISSFSNTPGNACLLDSSSCREALMNRFIVAPGELMIVPDGQGGFVRRSGTSFAAPLVSGAITLLHDRWPWLAERPRETVEIILQSARDLGAPGVDPVYGHGLLDVQASQSPLDFARLRYFEMRNGVRTERSAASVLAGGLDTTWQAQGVYFHMLETIGGTHRDFTVPLSTLLSGTVRTLNGASEYYQHFLQGGFTDWIRTGGTPFSDVANATAYASPELKVTTSFALGGRTSDGRFSPSHSGVRIGGGGDGPALLAGWGMGALALSGQAGLAPSADHGRDGAVNPVLGLASGGAYVGGDAPLGHRTRISAGYTQRQGREGGEHSVSAQRTGMNGPAPLAADAVTLRVSHQATAGLTLTGGYALVRERNGILGVQSRASDLMRNGAGTDTFSLGSSLRVDKRFTLNLSGTLGRSRADRSGHGFSTDEAVVSTAFAASATWEGVLGRRDALRFSATQPFHIEKGRLNYQSIGVIDRQTGELGTVSQPFDIDGGRRPLVGELQYAAPILDEAGDVALFGRAPLRSDREDGVNQSSVGARVTVRF